MCPHFAEMLGLAGLRAETTCAHSTRGCLLAPLWWHPGPGMPSSRACASRVASGQWWVEWGDSSPQPPCRPMPDTMSSAYVAALPIRLDLSGRVVVLATEGAEGSSGAILVALALAAEHGAVIQVVHVVDTRAIPIPGPLDLLVALGDKVNGSAVHDEQQAEVRAALSRTAGRAVDWPVAFLMGNPASTIVAEAHRVDAALIVVGLRPHGKIDRAVNDETAHKVMQHADCPVLGIVPTATSLPKQVLVAVDFSRTSLLAAHAAHAVAAHNARLCLVYVASRMIGMPDDGEEVIHTLGLEAAFARSLVDLADDDICLDHVVLHHDEPRDPADIVLEYAETIECDLLAAGSARHGRVEQWLLGSVSAALVHDGRRSVLIVPPPRTDK